MLQVLSTLTTAQQSVTFPSTWLSRVALEYCATPLPLFGDAAGKMMRTRKTKQKSTLWSLSLTASCLPGLLLVSSCKWWVPCLLCVCVCVCVHVCVRILVGATAVFCCCCCCFFPSHLNSHHPKESRHVICPCIKTCLKKTLLQSARLSGRNWHHENLGIDEWSICKLVFNYKLNVKQSPCSCFGLKW